MCVRAEFNYTIQYIFTESLLCVKNVHGTMENTILIKCTYTCNNKIVNLLFMLLVRLLANSKLVKFWGSQSYTWIFDCTRGWLKGQLYFNLLIKKQNHILINMSWTIHCVIDQKFPLYSYQVLISLRLNYNLDHHPSY